MNIDFEMDTYRPLPKGLTIKESKIDGLGLHASLPHSAGKKFGETHVLVHSRDRPVSYTHLTLPTILLV